MKIFLADDHDLFLEGMQSVLTGLTGSVYIDSANNGHEALDKLSTEQFDIALVDLRLPGLDGFSLLKELSSNQCLTPVIMVTASEDPWDIQKALDLGAMGFVPKSSNGAQIKQAIESVLRGEIVRPCCASKAEKLNGGAAGKRPDWAGQHNITPRQLEVLRLIQHGLSNQAVADQLFLSLATVKTHIGAIFQALGTQSRTEAIQKARQLGLD